MSDAVANDGATSLGPSPVLEEAFKKLAALDGTELLKNVRWDRVRQDARDMNRLTKYLHDADVRESESPEFARLLALAHYEGRLTAILKRAGLVLAQMESRMKEPSEVIKKTIAETEVRQWYCRGCKANVEERAPKDQDTVTCPRCGVQRPWEVKS